MVVGTSYIKMILREFKKSFGRFAAIFGIVALGVGFLSGLLITTPNMNESIDQYYDNHNTADIFIKGTMGLTENDLKEIKATDNIKDIMPAYVIDKLMEVNNNEVITAKIYGVPLFDLEEQTVINKLELIEGRMPENENECVVERKGPYFKDIKIGSNLKISKDNKDYDNIDEMFHVKEYEVVGIVGNSFHFALEREVSNVGSGKLDTIVYVDKTSYSFEEFTDFYIVLEDTLEMNSFSSEYKVYTEKIRKQLEDLGKKRSAKRKREVLDKANKELQDGFEEYREERDKAYIKLSDAEKTLNQGKEELNISNTQLKNVEKELKDARKILKAEYKEGKKQLRDGKKELNNVKMQLLKIEKELNNAKLELEYGEKKYKEGYKDYIKGKRELEKGERELLKGKKEFAQREKEFLDGKRQLEEGKSELLMSRIQLENAQSQYENGLSQLNAGKSKFLYSIAPLAKEIGYSSPEKLISTPQGQEALKAYLIKADRDLASGINTIKMIKDGIEQSIPLLEAMKDALEGDSSYLIQLLAQLRNQNINYKEIIEQIEQLENMGSMQGDLPAEINEILKELEAISQELEDILNGLLEGNMPEKKEIIDILDALIVQLNNLLPELDKLIKVLEKQRAEIPEYSFLINTWNEILANEKELEKAKGDLDEGWRQYNLGLRDLRKSEEDIKQGEIQIQQGKKELEESEKRLQTGIKDLDEGFKELESSKEVLEEGKREYQMGLLAIKNGWREYENGIAEIEAGRKTLDKEIKDATKEIEKGKKSLAEGVKEYQKGLKEITNAELVYNNAKSEVHNELNKAHDELLEAQEEIRDLNDPEWYVLDRESNLSYVSFDLNSEKVAAISTVFPIFFYLVAGLVSLTTMTRMVEEERTQIGVLKALGYKKSTIILKYILYCGLASTLGSIVGQIVGFELIPRVIWNTYGVMYHLPEFITDYNKKIALLSSGVAILSTVAATYFAASDALKEKPALLMLPRAPKKGKRILLERITPLWSAMSFNLKSTARNIFRYKKHFYMTVIGVSGCTALLVAGFGIRDSIKDIGTLQFDKILNYQLTIQLEEDYSQNNLNRISTNHAEIQDSLEVFSDEGYLKFKKESDNITLVGVDDIDNISEYVLFKDRKKDEIIDFTEDKIIISEKIAEELNIQIGDKIIYENSDEIEKDFKVHGITENYVGNYIYMDKKTYESAFNDKKENNTLYIKTQELSSDEEDKLIQDLYQNEDILSAEFVSHSRGMFDNLIGSINYIVVLIIVASGLLAFIVLYNLTNININERRRELATLKVLGFHNKEVALYIFREITILAIIGSFVGLVLGKYLHQFIIITVEDPDFMFGRDISILSYLISAIITMLFSITVNLFMIKKLRNIEMVDSMKATD